MKTQPVAAKNRNHRLITRKRGAIAVLAALLMVVLVGMVAFGVDIGVMMTARTGIQRAVDSGALAAAAVLGSDPTQVVPMAHQYVQANEVLRHSIPSENIDVELGNWNRTTRTFEPGGQQISAIRVFADHDDMPVFFAGIFGHDRFHIEAEAIAELQPRDIVVVLDYSGSMNDDSELKHIGRLGQPQIEANLFEIYTELGSPHFGNMQWAPVFLPSEDPNLLIQQLGLESTPYPYPSGSWTDYINYVINSNHLEAASYKKKYGYLTLVNYWLEKRPEYSQTPDLWKTSEQPITAVKDSVTIFLAYLQEAQTSDRVGLSVYTSEDGEGKLEEGLTLDYLILEDISRQRQAGHYHRYTNIGGGMNKARVELEDNGRPNALKMIVLMTDGKANWVNGGYNPSGAVNHVLNEAQLAAEDGFPIITISLGADADTALMQQVADVTGGVHFNVPGGQSVEEYEEDLKEVFREIADHRPIRLVD